jgi:hypothetical protein
MWTLIAIALATAIAWMADNSASTRTLRSSAPHPADSGPRSTSEPQLITDMLGGACALGAVIASRAGRSDQSTHPQGG